MPANANAPGFRAGNTPELTVSELAGGIKRTLEDSFGHVRLKGEISGYRGPHSSGHCYFALKDDNAKIDAVIWKGVFGRIKFRPEEGMEVIATGKVTSYPNSSKYQIVIEAMEPAGVGALMALLEERKRRLQAEGLFAPERKRKLPFMPRVVGIVTSPTGAVIRDMLAGFAERFPTHVLVWPVRVQGETCGAEVAAAINGFNRIAPGGPIPQPDVLIVARGGGSLEDLWGFNDEAAVRAAADSRIPIVSAVGHETDWTLIDLAADARAPTPTKAAEWVVPKYSELLGQVADLIGRLTVGVRRHMEHRRSDLKAAARGLPRVEDLVRGPRQRFDHAEARLSRGLLANTRAHAMRHAKLASKLSPPLVANRLARLSERIAHFSARNTDGLSRLAGRQRARFAGTSARLRPSAVAQRAVRSREQLSATSSRASLALAQRLQAVRDRLDARAGLLNALSYQGVLARGYAVVRDGNGQMVRSAAAVTAGGVLGLEFQDGEVRAQAIEDGQTASRPMPSTPAGTKPRRAKLEGPNGGPQGSLF
ncbi:MAG: exodeoxyribonuclease VII large subunit [Hyphomicrobiaceae bacterium]|nr:exodeoxyribonuclease VII large subunit [Hyphomicrobiaceae bacterium]